MSIALNPQRFTFASGRTYRFRFGAEAVEVYQIEKAGNLLTVKAIAAYRTAPHAKAAQLAQVLTARAS